MESPLPDVMGPQNVVAVLDTVSNTYASFLNTNLFFPVQASYALAADNISYVFDNAGHELALLTGYTAKESGPQVAGASVAAIESTQ